MKKILSLLILFVAPFAVNAQDDYHLSYSSIPRQFFEIPATIFAFYLLISFIISIIRSIFDYRLKMKMIDKGVPDEVVKQFLQPNTKDIKAIAIKWCLMLAGLGLGFTLIGIFPPFGIHSIAIMAFSLALSFLGYFFFIKKAEQ